MYVIKVKKDEKNTIRICSMKEQALAIFADLVVNFYEENLPNNNVTKEEIENILYGGHFKISYTDKLGQERSYQVTVFRGVEGEFFDIFDLGNRATFNRCEITPYYEDMCRRIIYNTKENDKVAYDFVSNYFFYGTKDPLFPKNIRDLCLSIMHGYITEDNHKLELKKMFECTPNRQVSSAVMELYYYCTRGNMRVSYAPEEN